ncbi:MAG: YjjG family noncanonical pyrimidine nucleotidase [Bacteroidales bacterium]|jgi:putative hydrolase of the HAD superfamily|nr:YjjG family noncanonical pyrimidine nucleotidase [Bacteroidales bacterium]
MKYTTLFFDLDNTLWDFDKNYFTALSDIYKLYKLDQYCNLEEFLSVYQIHNHKAWDLYKKNLISSEEVKINRFINTFEELGIIINENDIKSIGNDYLDILSQKTNIFPNVKESLDQLRKYFKLHIISNGFIDVQINKLKNCGLIHYFDQIITSEAVGYKKPDARIFEYALKITNTPKHEAIYIGDEFETDIIGTNNADIDSVWFNPKNSESTDERVKATFEVKSFNELLEIFTF